jgi:hypothetical protein
MASFQAKQQKLAQLLALAAGVARDSFLRGCLVHRDVNVVISKRWASSFGRGRPVLLQYSTQIIMSHHDSNFHRVVRVQMASCTARIRR